MLRLSVGVTAADLHDRLKVQLNTMYSGLRGTTDEGMELARSSGVIEHGIPSIWAWDVRGSAEPTKIWADFETTTVQHLESLVWSKYAKRKEGLPLAKLDAGVVA